MPADEYDTLLKVQLQRLARKRGLDTSGTVAALRDRLRAQDAEAGEPPNALTPELDDEDEDDEDEFPEDEEEDEEEEASEDNPDPVPPDLAMADPGDDPLKDGYFQHTVVAGNTLFFGNTDWHDANKEMALLAAQGAGYRYHPSMGKVEYKVDGNSVHYRFPVEKEAS